MHKLAIAPALAVILAFGAASAAPLGSEETTTWKGALNIGETRLRLEIEVTTDAVGKQSGTLRSLDQGNAQLRLSSVETSEGLFRFTVDQIGARFEGSLSEDGAVAEGTFSQSGVELPLKLTKGDAGGGADAAKPKETLREAWVGRLKMGPVEPVMQFRIVTTENGEAKAYFDSVTEGRTGFAAEWSIEGDSLSFDVPSIRLTYRGTLNQARDAAEGTWSQAGREFPLTLEKRESEFDNPNSWENRPQRPKPPFPYDRQPATFENAADGVTLAGTLTIPDRPGRHPAVVLVSGSGPQDRDESLMGHKPFLVLADYLTRRGIAVLRYDDRGTAQSSGDFGGATTEDFARDASAAVDFLKRHERIDPARIGLAGHSEGGLVAPMVANRRDDVAFLVLLAATGVDGIEVIQSQTEALGRAGGAGDAAVAADLAINRAILEAVSKNTSKADLDAEIARAVDAVIGTLPEDRRESARAKVDAALAGQKSRLRSPWLRFFLSYDPRPALERITCPVLAIFGSKDLQVLPRLHAPVIRAALEKAGNKDFEVVEMPGLNHLFQRSGTGAISEYAGIQETFNPAALKVIGDWVLERTAKP